MPFPALNDYLRRLSDSAHGSSSLWLSHDGHAQGQFLNCVLTSAFQPIRAIDDRTLLGFEGLARGVSDEDAGLSLWRLLDHSCGEDESIELDRLCRMLHAINFFRQPDAGGADLYLSVHDRLLSAVSSNHGYAFRRILVALGLPTEQIVLQLPAVGPARRWLANYVADNYRRNGFRLAFNAASVVDAMEVVGQLRPYAVKIDARALRGGDDLQALLELAQAGGARMIFKRIETAERLGMLARASADTGVPIFGQGDLLDAPQPALPALGRTPAPGISRSGAASTDA